VQLHFSSGLRRHIFNGIRGDIVKHKKVWVSILALIILLKAVPSYALDMEYITYGNFDTVFEAFHSLSLWLSDTGWQGLMFVAVMMGIFFGFTTIFAKGLSGQRTGILAPVAFPVLAGLAVYIALFSPASTGTLTIYDKNLNKFQQVSLPNGIILVVGSLNKIEQGLADIFGTPDDPNAPRLDEAASWIGYDLLYRASSAGKWKTSHIYNSLKKYYKDCVFFELERPGTTLTVDEIESTTTDFIPTFEKAVNPAIYTVYYDDAHPTGVTMTCTEAWTNIKTYLQDPNNFDEMLKSVCAASGINPDDPVQYSQCKSIISKYCEFNHNQSICSVPENYIRQVNLAWTFRDVLIENGNRAYQALMQSKNIFSSIGSLMSFHRYLPQLKGWLTAIIGGITAFLIMFLPTPLFGRILINILGLFVWLTMWNVADILVNRISLNEIYKAFTFIRQNNMGLDAILYAPDTAFNGLAMIGTFRALSLILSTFLSGLFVKTFGSHVMAMMAGNLMGQVQSSGASAGIASQDPSQVSSQIKAQNEVMPTETWANAYRFDIHAAQRMLQEKRAIDTNLRTMDALGGGGAAVESLSHAGAMQNVKTAYWGDKLTPAQAAMLGEIQRFREVGQAITADQFRQEFRDAYLKAHPHATEREIDEKAGAFLGYFHSAARATEALRGLGPDKIDRFLDAGAIRVRRDVTQQEAFREVAERYGGVENFSKMLSEKNYLQLGRAIRQYADLRGIKDLNVAAREMGVVLGRKEGASVKGDRDGLSVVGADGFAHMRANEILNEAAKFEQTYQFAKDLGYAGSREDFEGMYKGHLAHHAHESWALQDQAVVDNLNRIMEEQGYKTRFKVGDSVRMARTADGKLTLVKGEAGASREEFDLESLRASRYINKTMDVNELKELQQSLRDKGHLQAAKNVGLAIQRMQEQGYNAAEVSISQTGGPDSQYATLNIRSGTESLVSDFTLTKVGWENMRKALTTERTGVDREHIMRDKTTRAVEYDISSGTMNLFASSKAPHALINTIGSDLYSKDGKINDVVAIEQAKAGQKMLDEIVKQSGHIFTTADIDGSGNLHFEAGSPEIVKFLGGLQINANSDIGVKISRTNQEIWDYNLRYGTIRRLQEKAREVATFGGKFHPEIAHEYYQKGMQEYKQIADDLAKGKTDFEFGADSIIGEPLKESIRWAKQHQEEFMKGVKEILDSGKPYPLASKEEQERRRERLDEFMKKYKGD